MVHSFKSATFNGVNFSNTAMTIENLARTRKQSIKEVAKSEAEQAKIQASNTPLNTFINNLQARIYSQLASQVTDQIFNSNGATFGVINLQGGSTITWQRNGDFATLYIVDPATGTTTQITVPIGSLTPATPGG
jgi:3'-phosphoadenosine 5'-phosphosulfate (PAPS) 3'-phosphatase